MKKILLMAVIVLFVVAGVFFLNTTPRVPLGVGLLGVANRPTVGLAITVSVTNFFSRPLLFDALVLTESNGVWSSPSSDYAFGGKHDVVEPGDVTQTTVETHETPSVVRLRIHCWRHKTDREKWIEGIRQKFGLRAAADDLDGRIIITEPIALPAR